MIGSAQKTQCAQRTVAMTDAIDTKTRHPPGVEKPKPAPVAPCNTATRPAAAPHVAKSNGQRRMGWCAWCEDPTYHTPKPTPPATYIKQNEKRKVRCIRGTWLATKESINTQ